MNLHYTRIPAKYSPEWIKGLTEEERDIIWQGFCNSQCDTNIREIYKNILVLFDKVKSDK